jgi:hypothetical protein
MLEGGEEFLETCLPKATISLNTLEGKGLILRNPLANNLLEQALVKG